MERYVRCRHTCPFAVKRQVAVPAGPGQSYYMPSLVCLAADEAIIVNPDKKPDFCPMPVWLDWEEN